jgi:DNA-binding transcriptional ArsR family regulator
LKYSLALFQNLLNNGSIETIEHADMSPDTAISLSEEQAVRALAALAQATRLRLFRALVVAGQSGLSAGALSTRLGIAPSALSFHLKELNHANLIEGRQDGRFMFYSARFDEMNALLGFLTDNCCQGGQNCVPQSNCAC